MTAQKLAAGSTLFHQDDRGECLCVMTRGSMSTVGRSGHRCKSKFPGLLFGEPTMLDGRGRSASAVAATDSVVHALSLHAIEAPAADDPARCTLIMRNLALHLTDPLRAARSAS